MELIVIFLIFVIGAYQQMKKFIDSGMPDKVLEKSSKVHDPQELIRRILTGNSSSTTSIPIRIKQTDNSGELFKEDKWRRRLFLVCLAIAVGYLVYLLMI